MFIDIFCSGISGYDGRKRKCHGTQGLTASTSMMERWLRVEMAVPGMR